jgi:hypothetical protein
MKSTAYKIFSVAFALLLIVGCTSNFAYTDVAVYPVSSLRFPADNEFLELQSGTGRVVEFSWSPGAADDGNPVQYELLFMSTSTGNPVAVVDAGLGHAVSMTHKDLNKIVGMAGVPSGEAGTVYWAIRTSRGPNSVTYDTPNQLHIRRMLGFDEIPARLFLTGAASETGTDLAAAREFKLTSAAGDEGEFEIYTAITDGTFNMVSSLDASRRTFGIVANLLEETTDGASIDPGVYRINVDFTVKGITLTRIEEVMYSYMQNRSENTALEYVGGGRWQLQDFELKFARPGWGTRGFEERYRFEVVTSMQNEVWGPLDASLDGAPSSLNFNSDYFTVVARPRTHDWDPKWKWHGSVIPDLNEAGGTETNPWKKIDLYLEMSGGRYYHYYESAQ